MTDSPDITPLDPDLAAIAAEEASEVPPAGFDYFMPPYDPDAPTYEISEISDLEAGNSAADDVPPPTDADDTTDQANEPIVITGTMNITLPDDFLGALDPPSDFVEGADAPIDPDATPDFPVGPAPVVKEHIPHPPLPEPPPEATHIPPTADESDDERARRLEKESLSRSERLRRGW